MSDTFNHYVDAMESYDRAYDDGCLTSSYDHYHEKDPLYYFTKVDYMRIVTQTEKAYLFQIGDYEGVWVAKSVCRKLDKNSVYVHTNTYRKIKSIELRQEII